MRDLRERLSEAVEAALRHSVNDHDRPDVNEAVVDAILAVLSSEQASPERVERAWRGYYAKKPHGDRMKAALLSAGPVVVRDSGERLTEEKREEVLDALYEADGMLSLIGYRYAMNLPGTLAKELIDASLKCRKAVAKLERGASVSPSSPPDVMPVFAIKAKDNFARATIEAYRQDCIRHGLTRQAREVQKAIHEIVQWRLAHPDECKFPDHEHVSAGQPGSGPSPSSPVPSVVERERKEKIREWSAETAWRVEAGVARRLAADFHARVSELEEAARELLDALGSMNRHPIIDAARKRLRALLSDTEGGSDA